jgi:hypothetical protein
MKERTRAELDAMTDRMVRQAKRGLAMRGVTLPDDVIREVAMRAAGGMTAEDLRYSLWIREQADAALQRADCDGEA